VFKLERRAPLKINQQMLTFQQINKIFLLPPVEVLMVAQIDGSKVLQFFSCSKTPHKILLIRKVFDDSVVSITTV